MRAVVIIDQPANYLPRDFHSLGGVQTRVLHQRPSHLRRKGYDDSDTTGNHSEASYLERAMGFEPTTFCLASRSSTTELRQH